MQTVVIIPEPEWRQVLQRLDKLEQVGLNVRAAVTAADTEILNVREAAARLGMKPDGLRKARRAGRIKGVRINEKSWGFKGVELDRYQRRYDRPTA